VNLAASHEVQLSAASLQVMHGEMQDLQVFEGVTSKYYPIIHAFYIKLSYFLKKNNYLYYDIYQ
jgi:hypothetical protein